MALFTVFGNPIAHSLSPQIHALFAAQFQLTNSYTRSLCSPGQFAATVSRFFRTGGAGANVTLPFKEAAVQVATHLSERAREAGAVNTLVPLGQGQLLGDNTDGLGLVRDLQTAGVRLSGLEVILLGAGGAARGVLPALMNAGVKQITLVNRTRARAGQLAGDFPQYPLKIVGARDLQPLAEPYLIVNATSASLTGAKLQLPKEVLGSAACVYDMMYSGRPTAFLQEAAQAGAGEIRDGLGMLVEQAGVAFSIWHGGLEPDTAPVLAKIRRDLLNR
ncbi:hypothetical protein IDSA_07380 [Pseudidiomarina salinarum]|uniref:Shikimate dehydrogenase (NADP(+)) n=1 Tax=Pseudidiomarina salinarum TaxID=435908 RepID=A0A094IT88_9GAMM|nr:shikimate dehydrogenase [Pseudidiomarina salinarum]KFZ30890.1 hypothetical protein IDSA_07380 [Pseudidiomarina salinarum]RUO71369.1 shikimate dehydrogenase [Pseudidiomarina salinarum]